MKLTFEGSGGWSGQVIFQPAREEFKESCPSIHLWVRAPTEERAKAALDYLVDMYASGRTCVFRDRPEISGVDGNFDTKEEWWQGFMRFWFVPSNDKWSDVEPLTTIPLGEIVK